MTLSPTKKPGGRKSKLLDAFTMARLEDALKAGNTIRNACAMASISDTTYYRWLDEAEAAPDGHVLREFRDTIKRAMAVAVNRNVLMIQEAAKHDWRAAAWFLERRCPKDWGRPRTIAISGHAGAPPTRQEIPTAVVL